VDRRRRTVGIQTNQNSLACLKYDTGISESFIILFEKCALLGSLVLVVTFCSTYLDRHLYIRRSTYSKRRDRSFVAGCPSLSRRASCSRYMPGYCFFVLLPSNCSSYLAWTDFNAEFLEHFLMNFGVLTDSIVLLSGCVRTEC